MKFATAIFAAMLAAVSHGATVRNATETFVTNKIAEAVSPLAAGVSAATNSLAAIAASTNGFVKKTGDTMTGNLSGPGWRLVKEALKESSEFEQFSSEGGVLRIPSPWAPGADPDFRLGHMAYEYDGDIVKFPAMPGTLALDWQIADATNAVAAATREWAVESYGATNVWYDRHGEWLRLVETDGGAETNVVWDQATATTNLYAAWVTSGTFDAARIPSLAAGKITSGTFDAARIPNLAAGKITSGTLGADRIPGLAASKITSGTFADARLPHTAATTNRLHYVTGVLTLNLASGATLLPPASATQWPEGAAVFTVINPAGAYTVDPAVKLLGYGSWPTNTAECVVVRSAATSTNYFVNVLREAGE